MFEEIVLDIWKQKQAERLNEKYRLERELQALKVKKSKLVDLLIQRTIDEEIYRLKEEEIKTKIFVKNIAFIENEIELNDAESCVNYCKYFLSNIATLWENADLNLKQRFQNLIFPDGIHFNRISFRTARTALVFKQLEGISNEESRVVRQIGIN